MDLASLRDRLFRLLPILIIVMTIFGIALFAIRTLIPDLTAYNALSEIVLTQQSAIATQVAERDDSDNILILQRQAELMQEQMRESSAIFLTRAESEQVLNRIYDYAYSRGVRVINLQSQQPDPAVQSPGSPPYETTVLQLQVTGGVANLIDFIAHIREATLPGVSIQSVNVNRTEGETSLTMTIFIYTSPFASGEVLNSLPTSTPTLEPTPSTATPTETPSVTPTVTRTPTPTATLVPPTATATFTPTLSLTMTPEGTIAPTVTPSPTEPIIECPGAPESLFRVGDVAVVDFNGLGALRVMSDPNGSVNATRTQAYDNQQLEIIAGPVCARSTYYWYIRNTSLDNTLGWVAEAITEQRFLCPVSNPECTDLLPPLPTTAP